MVNCQHRNTAIRLDLGRFKGVGWHTAAHRRMAVAVYATTTTARKAAV
jgi:hypothetical protein